MSVIKSVDFPDRTFETKRDMFLELKKFEKSIIAAKKSTVYKSSEKCKSQTVKYTNHYNGVSKTGVEEGFIMPIISTTRWVDSHKDCHFDGCFTKTVKDQSGNVHYALDHELRYKSIIVFENFIEMVVKNFEWKDVGKNINGTTEGLAFKFKEEDVRIKSVLEDIKAGVIKFENSIRMKYYKIFLGIDSDDEEFKANKKYYDSRYESIANKEELEESPYFWGVEELGIVKEGSLVTAGGSNSATAVLYHKNSEPLISTHNQEPPSTPNKSNKKLLL